MTEQDKRRAELMRAIDEYADNCVGAEHSLCAEPSSARINAAIDALLGDVVATGIFKPDEVTPFPQFGTVAVAVSDNDGEPIPHETILVAHSPIDPNATYEMTISLRRVSND